MKHRTAHSQGNRRTLVAVLAGTAVFASAHRAGAAFNAKLNDPLVAGGDVMQYHFAISPDSARVVYRADQDSDGVDELYSVPIAGGTVVKLNDPLVTGGQVTYFAISPDSSRVVYRADQGTDEVVEVYSVPITGGTATGLNGPLVSGGSVRQFSVSPDSSRVVYRADQHTYGMYEIYSVPIAGGTATKLNHSLSPGGTTSSPAVSADSRRVVYQGRQDSVWAWKLHSVPLTGGTVAKLNGRMQPDGDVRSFMISADSARVVYVADQDTDGDDEIYSSAMYRSDLSVGKTVDNEDPKEGDSVVFTIRCWNNGPDDLTGCEVTDLLPAGVTYQSHSTAGTYTPGSGVWDVGPLTASGLGALTIWATVDSGTMGETITNTATVTASDLPDPDTGNDSDSAAVTVGAGVHYVTPHGDHVTPFINWDNAATTIQAAVDVALDGATVWVSNGVYSVGGKALDEFSVTNRVCIENNILVQSVTGPDDTHIVGAADPATTNGPAAARCVYIAGTAGLSGFTLRDGHTHDGDGEEYYGGGVYFAGGGTLSNCVIRNCGSYEIGGGAYMQSGGELIDCLIVSNRSMFGGGVYLSGGSAAHCRILDNVADDAGGGAHMDDGELFTCLLAGNTAGTDGGGVSLSYDGSITFCTVAGNHAGGNGGGFYGYGGGYLWTTILYGNTAEGSGTNWYDEFADASHEYCCTTPEPVGESNVVANPMFVNAGVGNYRLQGSSPCIDAGGEEGFLGPDLDGVPRAQDGDGDGTDTVDIGCYEYVMDADLAVFKSDVSDPVIAGRMLTYTILVTNTGPGEAASVVVADSLPASVTFDAAGSPGWGETGGIATYTVGTLGNGAGTGLTLRVHVPASHIGNLSNEVGVTSMTPDQATENNAAFALTEVIAQSDLALEKTDWPDPVVSSNTIVYTIAVTNSGPSYAWDVAVTDSLPEGVTFDAGASPGWSATNGVYVYSVGTLPDGGMTSLTLRVTVADTTTGTITNEAGTGTSATDTNLTDNAALEDTTIADLDGDGDPDFHDPDDDGDTMWDTWEDDHGLNPTNAADATGNPDHDPHINREEFVADTNPTDSNDYLRITAISNNSPVTVYFKSSSDRLYTVIGCSNLAEGIWTNVPGAGPEQGAGGADSLQDTNLPARGPFYRLEAELPE